MVDDTYDDDIKQWAKEHLSAQLEVLADDLPKDCPHASSAEEKAKLIWLAQHHGKASLDEIRFTDGPHDGGMDFVSEVAHGGTVRYVIFQCHGPKLENLKKGIRLVTRWKMENDLGKLANTFDPNKPPRSLNETAMGVRGDIRAAIDQAQDPDHEGRVEVVVQPISFAMRREDDWEETEGVRNRIAGFTGSGVTWEVRQPIDLRDIWRQWKDNNSGPRKITVKIELAGEVARSGRERGPQLFFAKAKGFIQAYDSSKAAILEYNMRYAMGVKGPVNAQIAHQLSTERGVREFVLKNNGLVVTAASFSKGKGNVLTLKDVQVVNGGQTLSTMHSVYKELWDLGDAATEDQQKARKAIRDEMVIAVRMLPGLDNDKVEDIAIASNTQTPLSKRTMFSAKPSAKKLRHMYARLSPAWFVETKDGEWQATSKNTSQFKRRTLNMQRSAFIDGAGHAKGRVISNERLGEALRAFFGQPSEARASRLFLDPDSYSTTFQRCPKGDAWSKLASKPQLEDDDYRACFDRGLAPASLGILALIVLDFWLKSKYTEGENLAHAYDAWAVAHPEFRDFWDDGKGRWNVPADKQEELKLDDEFAYWPEFIINKGHKALVWQSMRVLHRFYGDLTDSRCVEILAKPNFAELMKGQKVLTVLPDWRRSPVAKGPLYLLARVIHLACRRLWDERAQQLRSLGDAQQSLVSGRWMIFMSEAVDKVLDRVGDPKYRDLHDLDAGFEVADAANLRELLEACTAAAGEGANHQN